MKNKTALFFLVITISTTSLSISEEYVKNLKDETNNNKMSNHTLDEKKSEIKKEGNGWSSWSTRDKIVVVGFAATCIVAVAIIGFILKIEYDIRNPKGPTSDSLFLRRMDELEQLKRESRTLDALIKKLEPTG